jgi:hypothetical protein
MSLSSALNTIYPLLVLFVLTMCIYKQQVTVAARSKARSFGRWGREFESHLGVDFWWCMRLFYVRVVLCLGSGLATG